MKKVLTLLIVAVMCLSLTACGAGETPNTENSSTGNTESPYANHPLLAHLYGEWKTTTEGNSFTSFTIHEDGSCIVDGAAATWKVDAEYTSEENFCIGIYNGTEYLGGVMVWGINRAVCGVAANHGFSKNEYERVND